MEVLFVLLIVLTIITLVGHGIWVVIRTLIRFVFLDDNNATSDQHVTRLFDTTNQTASDLFVTERQIVRFYRDGKLNDEMYERLMNCIRAERANLSPQPVKAPAAAPVTTAKPIETPPPPPLATPPSVTESFADSDAKTIPEPAPSFINNDGHESEPRRERFTSPPRARRSFSEVLNAFMEESNIRWGEIIGGLLIIGCSTALVVSLWAQISQIPVLKFLIFTTVTAILFGIGLYTEHRWKLPTTSRGILTIATLLVPLNFLAIAAVSASNSSGALVIGSELLAPAIFLCLVYFAGRVITPGCAHVLSAGVLGSSIGQLLVRHFAAIDASPALLVLLGAFPVVCYVATVGIALRIVLDDREIDEQEVGSVFTMLGTMSFAALLPFGLLLYKSGPVSMSMMYLAPLVTLWGLPMLATGTILWRKINNKELAAARTTGTALGLLGVCIVLAGMILAWPNPASIVPAALLNFAVFTMLAITLRLPVAHVIAAICFALAYLVTGHVLAGNITWQNLRVMSLLRVSLSVTSGEALVGAFALFVIASEWLSQRRRERDSRYYLISACLIASVSLALATFFGLLDQYPYIWIVYALYSLGAFWIAWRHKLEAFTWAGSALLLFSLAHNLSYQPFSFPWQTALFAHATICAIAAIVSSRYERGKVLSGALNYSALISIVLGVIALFQANTWEVTWMQAQRVFWIAGILLTLLWLNRRRLLLNAFQIALLCALVLTVKATLQQYEWYAYLPHAFMHPVALQIQGTVLALFCLAWVAARLLTRRFAPQPDDQKESWLGAASRLLNTSYALDRFLLWLLPGAFLLLVFYGTLSGLTREFSALGSDYQGFNIAGFPHQEALALGSWIVLGLLLVAMLMSFWERRRNRYLLGAIAVLAAIVPLIAGQFENQIATATAWRWLAAMFLLVGSLAIWWRNALSRRLATLGWPELEATFAKHSRTLLIVLTLVPLLALTFYPAARAIYYLPVQAPISGFFAWFDDTSRYGFPLVLAALVLIGYALRERMPQFAFYAGMLFNTTVTLAFLLAVVTGGGSMDRVVLVRLVQLNAMTLAVYLLPWLSTRGRWQMGLSQSGERLTSHLLKLQLALAVVLNVALFLPVVMNLIWLPGTVGIGTGAAGSFLGWLSFFSIVVAAIWLAVNRTIRLPAHALGAFLIGLSCLTAFNVADVSGWFALQILTVCIALTAWLLLAAAELTHDRAATLPFSLRWLRIVFELGNGWQSWCRRLAATAGVIAAFLSLHTLGANEASEWWTIGPLLAITALFATLNWQTQRRRYLYAAAVLFNFAASIWWTYLPERSVMYRDLLLLNVIAASLSGILWLWLELRARIRKPEHEPRLALHHPVAIMALSVFLLVVISGFEIAGPRPQLLDSAFFAMLLLLIACLWDRYAEYAVAGLYLLGLGGGALALQHFDLSPTRLAWSATIVLAVFTILATLLWHWRNRLIAFAARFGVPARITVDDHQLAWLSVFTGVAVATIAAFSYSINVSFIDLDLRVSAAIALTAQFLTFALLAEGVSARHWRRASIAVFVIGAILIGWSWLTPGVNATWLNRSVILMLITFGLTALYGWLLDRAKARWPEWTTSARACVAWLIGAGILALFLCLATEVRYQLDFGAVLIHPLSLAAIGFTLAAAVVICVLFALSPNHDPLSLSERGRMRYVYVGEVMLALLFLHIRLTMPWLFTGFIERYWPLIVMLIAYFGVVTSESLRRRKLLVVAQPLQRTGAFLPLLPVLGFWLASSEVDFSLLLFLVGGLYGLLSILRRSFGFGLLAAIAGNAGLWYMWNRTADYQFLQHPQLWLIPVALSVLLAAYLNEDKLSEDQLAGIRYFSLVTVYVSSTADIFINGVANSPWLPLILGSFSLAGVFAGILFRIRGLLLLGSIFLLLSITTMIWYASANFGWTWLWYVAGIVTGATIIFMFALFEKKRGEVLRVVEGLKDWEK